LAWGGMTPYRGRAHAKATRIMRLDAVIYTVSQSLPRSTGFRISSMNSTLSAVVMLLGVLALSARAQTPLPQYTADQICPSTVFEAA
jgi:hypothetical protein